MNFLALSGRESILVQTFCESCVHFDFTHSSIHMTRKFAIQGFPTINANSFLVSYCPHPVVTLRRNNFLIWKVLINSGLGKVRARGRSAMAAEIECRVCDLLR